MIMNEKVISGKEMLDNFFANISNVENVDKSIADLLSELYSQGKLSDTNLKNALQNLRENERD
jgi:hypothetical protein